jgi:hypothetical protein
MRFIDEYAIVGHYAGWRRTHSFRFAGGRSRQKMERIAQRMNESGAATCRVLLVRRRR